MFSYKTEEMSIVNRLPEDQSEKRIGVFIDKVLFPHLLRPRELERQLHPRFEDLSKGFHASLGKKFALNNPNTHATAESLFNADHEGMVLIRKHNDAIADFAKNLVKASIAVNGKPSQRIGALQLAGEREVGGGADPEGAVPPRQRESEIRDVARPGTCHGIGHQDRPIRLQLASRNQIRPLPPAARARR